MRKPSVAQLVYNASFPHQRPNDPSSFAAHVTRNLVPEVRVETNRFYGSLDCTEAQYPGLDYSSTPHRMRLGRFHWHKRLFKVFDELRLTREEILELCCWEGTKSARTRHEEEEGILVLDTTGDSIDVARPNPVPSVTVHDDFCGPEEDDDQDQLIETGSDETVRASDTRSSSAMSEYRSRDLEEYFSDEEMESCGVALNNRLMAAMAARDQGADVPLDEDYEQWLKEAGERGGYGDMVHAIRSNQPFSLIPEAPTSALRHERGNAEETPLATTMTAEQFLSTTSYLFTSSPVIPQSDTSEAAH